MHEFTENEHEDEMIEDDDEVSEILIKSKSRVQKHGEVFTPKWMVKIMLDQPEVKKACNELETTFLEPAAGEGVFLVEILRRKLKMVSKKYNDTLKQYENYALLALTTIYGIELLEDNAQICTQNLFEVFSDMYTNQILYHSGKKSRKVTESAKVIISANIAQGNFLTQEASDGKDIVLSEWHPKYRKSSIDVIRTEYTLTDILEKVTKTKGLLYSKKEKPLQISFFDSPEDPEEVYKQYRYFFVPIVDVYKEETEEYNG